MRYKLLTVIFLSAVILVFLKPEDPGFIDVAKQIGIKEAADPNGVSLTDYDNDGLLDILLVNGKNSLGWAGLRLFKNTKNGFEDTTQKSGIKHDRPAKAGIFGDYDNDGCTDLYISTYGNNEKIDSLGERDYLYKNNCNGTFTDVTEKAGISGAYHSEGAAWADYNRDGYIDLYVANFGVNPDGHNFRSEPNILYNNNGDGTFTDVAKVAGVIGYSVCLKQNVSALRKGVLPLKPSYQPVWLDYNNDGWPDLFIGTDGTVSPLYKNNGDGTFEEVTEKAGLCILEHGAMGTAIGDYDNDGDQDIYVANTGYNYLWSNKGNGTFENLALEAGVADTEESVGWGTVFFDYDNDGDQDIYVSNGSMEPKGTLIQIAASSKDVFFENKGNGKFSSTASKMGIENSEPTRGAASGDIDNDGFEELFALSLSEHNRAYKNKVTENHWIGFKLIGRKSNRAGIGAKITVETADSIQTKEVAAGSSYASQNSPWPIFGLKSRSRIEKVSISWPSGSKTELGNIQSNQMITVTEE